MHVLNEMSEVCGWLALPKKKECEVSKKVAPVPVEFDEVGLSILGWEIADFQARLVTEDYSERGKIDRYHEIEASMELRFHKEDWVVRHEHSRDYPSQPVWQLRSRSQGPLMGYERLGFFSLKQVRSPKKARATIRSWNATTETPRDLYLWVGAYDWEECDEATPGFVREPFESVQVIEAISDRGIGIDLVECTATKVIDEDGDWTLEVAVRAMYPMRDVAKMVAAAIEDGDYYGDEDDELADLEEFEIAAPGIVFELYDESGFMLANRDGVTLGRVKIGKGGELPARAPSSVSTVSFDVSDLSGEPSRLVVRIKDPA